MLAALLLMRCRVKLKDYVIPPDDGADREELEQYSLKNFDLSASLLPQMEQSFVPPPSPVPSELAAPAPDPGDVQFGQHFTLLQPLYTPFAQPQAWKIPRWVVATVGLFFGSAAVFAIATCVVLLRDPKPATAEPSAVPTAAVVVTAPIAATVPAPVPKPPAVHNDASLPHRIVVSRHPSVVRRQIRGPRHVASRSASSSAALDQTETATRPPPQDALDKLLGESVAGSP